MKMVKKILGLIGMLLGISALTVVFTAFMQLGMQVLVKNVGLVISEDTIIGLSGSMGVAFSGIYAAFHMKKMGYRDFEQERESFEWKKALFYGALAICICHVLFSTVTTVLLAGIIPNVVSESTHQEGFWLNLLTGVIIAPITEELLFRAGLYTYISAKFHKRVALIISTLIFAVAHFYIPLDFLSCVLAGVVFAIIYDKTGNIWYSIVAHALCNLEALMVNTLASQGIFLQYEINGYSMYHVAIMVPAFTFLIWVAWRKKAWKNSNKTLLAKEGR